MTTRVKPRRQGSKKVTISLPQDLFADLESARKDARVDRSSWLQRAAEEKLARDRRAEADRRYIESYRNDPETPEEIAESMAAAVAAFRADPWP